MKRNLLLISNSTMAGEVYLGWCKELITNFLKKFNIYEVLFIPYAGVNLDSKSIEFSYNAYESKVCLLYTSTSAIVFCSESRTSNSNSWAICSSQASRPFSTTNRRKFSRVGELSLIHI